MTRHPLTVVGGVLTTLSAFLFMFVSLIDVFGFHSNPYFGLIFFVLLPLIFVAGLLMIPAGIIIERRRDQHRLSARRVPRIDLNDPVQIRRATLFPALTFV